MPLPLASCQQSALAAPSAPAARLARQLGLRLALVLVLVLALALLLGNHSQRRLHQVPVKAQATHPAFHSFPPSVCHPASVLVVRLAQQFAPLQAAATASALEVVRVQRLQQALVMVTASAQVPSPAQH
jgi:hypothetical protein